MVVIASTAPHGAGGAPNMVAIDSKIEQAMDLVKTHLMFAVREEVEILRAKIVDLETTVHRLETENAILREHVPAEILSKMLSSPSSQGNNVSGGGGGSTVLASHPLVSAANVAVQKAA